MIHRYFIITVFLIAGSLASCTSGKDSPADSHPGSGSVKGSSPQQETKKTDSAATDTSARSGNL